MTTTKEQRAEQAYECYQLRLNGATIREIAATVGIAIGTVDTRLKSYVEKRVGPSAEQYRALTIDRLERVLNKSMPMMDHKDPNVSLRAQEQSRKTIVDLFDVNGLRSLKVEHSGSVATVSVPTVEEELERLSNELGFRSPKIEA